MVIAWSMAPVESSSLLPREGEGEGGADLLRVQQVLVAQVSVDGRLSGVGGFLVAAYSMPRKYHRGWRQLTGPYLGVCVIIRITPYLSLCKILGEKPDDNRPTQWYDMGQKMGAAFCTDNVRFSWCAFYGEMEKLVRVEVGHTGRSVERHPHASLWRAVRMSFVRAGNHISLQYHNLLNIPSIIVFTVVHVFMIFHSQYSWQMFWRIYWEKLLKGHLDITYLFILTIDESSCGHGWYVTWFFTYIGFIFAVALNYMFVIKVYNIID